MIFTKKLLDKIEEISKDPITHLMNQGLNFQEALLKLCNFYGIEPEYCVKKSCEITPDEAIEIITKIREMIGRK